MKQAFEHGNYDKLQNLVKETTSPESYFYRGIMAENGLGQEVDIEQAKKFYQLAFEEKNGSVEAGIRLAKLYLQEKEGIEKAIKIYEAIIALDNKTTKFYQLNKFKEYSKYELTKLKAKKLFENHDLKNKTIENAQKLAKEYEEFIGFTKENSRLRIEASYNKALIDLWIAQQEIAEAKSLLEKESQEELKNFQKDKTKDTRDISGLVKQHEHELEQKLAKKIQENKSLKKATQKLEELSKEFRRLEENNPAAATLIGLEIEKCLESKEYDKAIAQCNEALKEDPNNSEIKLLKYSALNSQIYQSNVLNYEKLDQAFQLIREIRLTDPNNKLAERYEATMQSNLVRKIGIEILETLKEKSEYFDQKFQTTYISSWDTTKEEREFYIDYLSPIITDALQKSDYLKNKVSFSESQNAAKEISNRIWNDILNPMENNWKKIKEFARSELDHKTNQNSKEIEDLNKNIISQISTQISRWDATRSASIYVNLSEKEKLSIDKYKLFKETLTEKLENYYIRCRALIDPQGKLEVKLENSFGTIINASTDAASLVGAATGNIGIAGAGIAIRRFHDISLEAQKATLYKSAQSFAQIGEGDSAKARETFGYIAEKIVEEYGMQIDNVKAKDIERIAEVAAEKMLDQYRNASVTKELLEKFANPSQTAIDFVKGSLGIKSVNKEKPENILLRGIRDGQTKLKEILIDTEDDKQGDDRWYAHEIFDEPIITSDGEYFYCRKGQEAKSNKYGARFASEHQNYVNKNLSPKDKKHMKLAFKKHTKLLDSPAWLTKQEKEKNKEKEEEIKDANFAYHTRNLKGKRLVAISIMLLGVAAVATGGVVAAAVAIGLVASNFAYVAAFSGFIGLRAFIKGFKNVSTTTDELYKTEERRKASFLENAKKALLDQEKKKHEQDFQKNYRAQDISENIISPEVKKRWKTVFEATKNNHSKPKKNFTERVTEGLSRYLHLS